MAAKEKCLYLLELKKNKVLFVSPGCINNVLSAGELMKCVSQIKSIHFL